MVTTAWGRYRSWRYSLYRWRYEESLGVKITLRGKVLPVGGIKEKVLAAHRAGIKKVILPQENEKDLEEVPPQVRQELKFHLVDLVDHIDQVLPPALKGLSPSPR